MNAGHILVTGASGQLGQTLARLWVERTYSSVSVLGAAQSTAGYRQARSWPPLS